MRFFSTVDLANLLEQEKAAGKQGRLAYSLMHVDLVILDELGYLPFSQAGGALLFHLLSKLYERTSVVITTNDLRRVAQRVLAMPADDSIAGSADPSLPYRRTGNESFRFRQSSQTAKARIKSRAGKTGSQHSQGWRQRRKPNRSDRPALRKPASGYALRRFPQRTYFPPTSLQPVNDNRLRALALFNAHDPGQNSTRRDQEYPRQPHFIPGDEKDARCLPKW